MTKTRIGTMVSYEQVSATNQLILLTDFITMEKNPD
jgi:hypothetical protein